MSEDNFTVLPRVRSDNTEKHKHELIFLQRQIKSLLVVIDTMVENSIK